MADKKFNVGINHGKEAFYANGVSININQDKITLDFRQTTQRLDDFGEKEYPLVNFLRIADAEK